MSNLSLPKSRVHRTALFVRLSPDEVLRERQEKLVDAFNRPPQAADGGTIKVDVFSVQGQSITAGLTEFVTAVETPYVSPFTIQQLVNAGYTVVAPEPTPAPSGRIDSPTLRALASEAGYDQAIVSGDAEGEFA